MFLTGIFFIIGINIFSQSQDRWVMYVNSPEGLKIYSQPSLESNIIGVLSHGERLTLSKKIMSRETETINGIADYWYRQYLSASSYGWIFGGYLSKILPLDAPVILGIWYDKDSSKIYAFWANDQYYWEGSRTSDAGIEGSWKINTNTITIIKRNTPETVRLIVIDRDNINLVFQNNRTVRLIRNNDPW